MEWDTEQSTAKCLFEGKVIATAKLQHDAPFGVSYVNLQTLARERDFDGCYLRLLKKE